MVFVERCKLRHEECRRILYSGYSIQSHYRELFEGKLTRDQLNTYCRFVRVLTAIGDFALMLFLAFVLTLFLPTGTRPVLKLLTGRFCSCSPRGATSFNDFRQIWHGLEDRAKFRVHWDIFGNF